MIRFLLAVGSILVAVPAQAQSFNCNAAETPDEVLICQVPELGRLDERLADAYSRLRNSLSGRERVGLERSQAAWLSERRECSRDRTCIADAYERRIAELQNDAPAPASGQLPRRIGQCSETVITEIGSRLEGMPDSGSSVAYANGGGQVSYDVISGIRRSRVGDPVRLCLISIPEDCPPGDDRGRVYRATNLRTGAVWEAADSQHMCGGA